MCCVEATVIEHLYGRSKTKIVFISFEHSWLCSHKRTSLLKGLLHLGLGLVCKELIQYMVQLILFGNNLTLLCKHSQTLKTWNLKDIETHLLTYEPGYGLVKACQYLKRCILYILSLYPANYVWSGYIGDVIWLKVGRGSQFCRAKYLTNFLQIALKNNTVSQKSHIRVFHHQNS